MNQNFIIKTESGKHIPATKSELRQSVIQLLRIKQQKLKISKAK